MEKPILTGKQVEANLSENLVKQMNNLKEGQVLALYARRANSKDPSKEKVIVAFSEKVQRNNTSVSALSFLNSDDERFQSKSRRAWQLASKDIAEKVFNFTLPDDEAYVELGKILKPIEGREFRIVIREDVESSLKESERDYLDNYLKIRPSDNAYFYDEETGERVISRTTVEMIKIGEEVPHSFKKGEFVGTTETVSFNASDVAAI